MTIASMQGLVLSSVWMTPLQDVHPAWADETSAPMTFGVNLVFTNAPPIQVRPCEVSLLDAYPTLGIEAAPCVGPLEALEVEGAEDFPMVQSEELRQYLPAAIAEVKVWDSLGEGPDSAIQLVLTTGLTLTIRHQYPPMTLGIEIIRQGKA